MPKSYFSIILLLFIVNVSLKAQNIPTTDCGIVFVLSDQDFSRYQENLSTNKTCFAHDSAGNLIGTTPCPTTSTNAIRSASVGNEVALKQDPC